MPTPAPVIFGPTGICSNKAATYSIAAISGSSYIWSVSGGIIVSDNKQDSVVILWGAAGPGSVTVKQTSNFGCDSAMTLSTTIMPTPAPVISGPDSICSNRTAIYSVSAITGSTYEWSVQNGRILGSSSNKTVNILWDTAGSGIVTVKQTSSFGCDSTVSLNSTIMPTPAPVISGPDSICTNSTAKYSVKRIPGASYYWEVGRGTIITSSDSTEVTVRWGIPGDGYIAVQITSAWGCDSAVYLLTKVLPIPSPKITGPDSFCETFTAKYSATFVPGDSYIWSATGGNIIGRDDAIDVLIQWGTTGSGTVGLIQTNAFGCENTTVRRITRMPLPHPVISGTDTTCSNRHTVHSVKAVKGDRYQWTTTGGTIQNSSADSSITVLWGLSNSGSISVTQTTPFGCFNSASAPMKILASPDPVINGPDSICYVDMCTYSTIPGYFAKEWQISGGTILSPLWKDTILVKWDSAYSGEIRLKVSNQNGCDSLLTKTVKLLKLETIPISGPNIACIKHDLMFEGIQLPGNTYHWTTRGGNFVSSTNQHQAWLVFPSTGTHSVRLDYRNSNGCSGASIKNVQIESLEIPVITGAAKACLNSEGTYNKQHIYTLSNTPNDSLVYTWSSDASNTIEIINPTTIRVKWGTTGQHKLQLHQRNPITGCENSAEFTVEIGKLDPPNIKRGNYEGCIPLNVNFTEASGNKQYKCAWYYENKKISSQSHTSHSFDKTGEHQVKLVVTDEYGCVDSAFSSVTVYPKAHADFEILNNPPVYISDTVRLKNHSENAVHYFWDLDYGQTSTEVNPVSQYNYPGIYRITLWAYNGNNCPDTISRPVDVRVIPWLIVPNAFTPNGDGLNDYFSVNHGWMTDFEILILNRWGEILYRTTDINFKWDAKYMGEDVPSGVYVFKIFARDYYDQAIPLNGDITVLR